jgi:UDP-2,3-diacylglucosamine pyrophosphatase LpxH
VSTVEAIFDSIVSANDQFFEGLRNLAGSYPSLKLVYVPGNHDYVLNTSMGAAARGKLQGILPLQNTKGEKFKTTFSDSQHKLIAMHGHEWDPANRYGPSGAAIGDAIVIDLVLSLPARVSEKLDVAYDDPCLDFLHEVDNVRPHAPKVIAQWVTGRLDAIKKSHPSVFKVMDETFQDLGAQLEILRRSGAFENISPAKHRLDVLHKMADVAVRRFGALRVARRVPTGNEGIGPYGDFALNLIHSENALGGNFRFVVCGHTHDPVIVPLDSNAAAGRPAPLYLNTGTWRRVRRVSSGVRLGVGHAAFGCWDEECAIAVYDDEEQRAGRPEYEFHRVTRGIFN